MGTLRIGAKESANIGGAEYHQPSPITQDITRSTQWALEQEQKIVYITKEVEKLIEVPVEKIVTVEKEVVKYIDREVEVIKHVIQEVEKEVIKEVEKLVEVPREVTRIVFQKIARYPMWMFCVMFVEAVIIAALLVK